MKITMNCNKNNDISIGNALKQFIVTRKIDGLAEETLNTYMKHCTQFIMHLEPIDETGNCLFSEPLEMEKPCSELNANNIDNYIMWLKTCCNVNNNTINCRLRSIRTFINFCIEKEYINHFKVKKVKEQERLKIPYSGSETEILLQKPNMKKCSFVQYRNWVIECFFCETGNRRKTVCNVKIGHLDFENRIISVVTVKNKKPYLIPLSNYLKEILLEYLSIRGGTEDDYLFCTVDGRQLTPDALSQIIRRYNRDHGIEKTATHLFRYGFACANAEEGRSILEIQALLGHKTLAQTRKYITNYGAHLDRDKMDKYSVLGKHKSAIQQRDNYNENMPKSKRKVKKPQ